MTDTVSVADFDAAMLSSGAGEKIIAAAVSGGGDSMALALLLHDWAKARGGKILALTVDHGLRPGSAAEAQEVAEVMEKRGIAHKILAWEGEKPCTGIQAHARAARYNLLIEECKRRGIATLALAHNAEDQAETFWMRLAHGSGLDGLAGMSARTERDGIALIRPVLSFTRAQLRATCTARNVEWIEDPSNENEKFLRPRLRAFETLLAAEGLTPERLSATMQKLKDARAALEFFTARALETASAPHAEGMTLRLAPFHAQPQDIRRRALAALLARVNPQDYAPRAESLDRLLDALQATPFRGATLAGCRLAPGGGDEVLIMRESEKSDF